MARAEAGAAAASNRASKLRQAAFVYLHVGLLYEAAVWVFWREGLLPDGRGPVWLWLAIGAAIVAVVFWLLYFRRSVVGARVVWALHALRLPALIDGAFFGAAGSIPPRFYLTALVVVVINLWMLARAGWDL